MIGCLVAAEVENIRMRRRSVAQVLGTISDLLSAQKTNHSSAMA